MLLEILLGLAILALAVAGVMMFFSNASASQRTNDAISEVGQIVEVVHSLYGGTTTYNGLTTAVVAESKQLPSKWSDQSSTVVDPFSGTVTIEPTSANGGSNNAFTVEFAGLPDLACSKMATMDFGNVVLDITVDGSDLGNTPATGANISSVCSGTTNQHTIIWEFN